MRDQTVLPIRTSLATWLPDETLFSWCSRYHRAAANGADKVSARQLFGQSRAGTADDLPGGLDSFAGRTEGFLGDARTLVFERTLLGFYTAFRPENLGHEAVSRMRSQGIGSLKYRLGLLTSGLGANHPLKACPLCMLEDEQTHCVAYWHRAHQWPTALVCLRHGARLMHSDFKTQSAKRFSWALPRDVFRDGETRVGSEGEDEAQQMRLLRLARISEAVASASPGHFSDARKVAKAFRSGLDEHGLLGAGGRLRWGAVLEAACAYFDVGAGTFEGEFLKTLATPSVLRRVFDGRGLTHSARYVVLIEWLFGDWARFERAYQSDGPEVVTTATCSPSRWKTSDAERETALATLLQGELSTRAIADSLGVDYSTVAAWAAQAGIAPRRRPKALHPDRLQALIDGLRAGREKAQIAADVGVSLVTVTRILRSEPGLAEQWHRVRHLARRACAREHWQALIDEAPGVSLRLLRAMAQADYAWLYRNDRQWLRASIEARSSKPVRSNHASARMMCRDLELAAAIERTAARMIEEAPERRPCWADIVSALPTLGRRRRYLERFPVALRALERVLL